MIPKGVGFYVWKMDRCGGVDAIVKGAKDAGLGHVIVKLADGTDTLYNQYAITLAAELKYAGVETWGYQYVYLNNPEKEAQAIASRLALNGFYAGLILDVEKECKNKPDETNIYCQTIRKLLPTLPIGLASYRYPHLHKEIAWQTWREICDFDMPQVYWQGAHNPEEQLIKSMAEFAAMGPRLPYVPTGSAYSEYDWAATPEDIADFILECDDLRLTSYNFWEWYEAKTENPDLWYVIANTDPPEEPEPDLPDTLLFEAMVDGQNIRSAPRIAANNIVGHLSLGQVLSILDVSGVDVWACIGCDQWAAIKLGARQYLRLIKEI